jgi:hypothetical protein
MWSAAKGGGPAARAHFRLKRARQRITDAHALLLRAEGVALTPAEVAVPSSLTGTIGAFSSGEVRGGPEFSAL